MAYALQFHIYIKYYTLCTLKLNTVLDNKISMQIIQLYCLAPINVIALATYGLQPNTGGKNGN